MKGEGRQRKAVRWVTRAKEQLLQLQMKLTKRYICTSTVCPAHAYQVKLAADHGNTRHCQPANIAKLDVLRAKLELASYSLLATFRGSRWLDESAGIDTTQVHTVKLETHPTPCVLVVCMICCMLYT